MLWQGPVLVTWGRVSPCWEWCLFDREEWSPQSTAMGLGAGRLGSQCQLEPPSAAGSASMPRGMGGNGPAGSFVPREGSLLTPLLTDAVQEEWTMSALWSLGVLQIMPSASRLLACLLYRIGQILRAPSQWNPSIFWLWTLMVAKAPEYQALSFSREWLWESVLLVQSPLLTSLSLSL